MEDAVIEVCSFTSSDLALQIAENCTYVLVSPTSVYEKTNTVYTKSNIKLDYDSQEPYIRGKAETKLCPQKFQEQNLILKPCMIIRPGENTGRTKVLKELSTEDRELKTSHEPSSLIQLIDVRDCANQIDEAVISRSHELLNIVSPPVQIRDFIDAASKAIGGHELEIEYRSAVDDYLLPSTPTTCLKNRRIKNLHLMNRFTIYSRHFLIGQTRTEIAKGC